MDLKFDKKLMSKRQAVISIALGLLAFWLILYIDNKYLQVTGILLSMMIISLAFADLFSEKNRFIARSLRKISFALNVTVLFMMIFLGIIMIL